MALALLAMYRQRAVLLALILLRSFTVDSQPIEAASASPCRHNGTKRHIGTMLKWDLGKGSMGWAPRPRALPQVALPF